MQTSEKNNETPNVETFSFGELIIRVVIDEHNKPFFVAADVLKGLELDRKALERIDEDAKGVKSIHTLGGVQLMSCLNESGLYDMILGYRSSEKKPKIKAFKKWVTSEVLPAIRKHGYYTLPTTEKNELLESVRGMVEKAFDAKMDDFIKQYVFPAQQKNQGDIWRINTDLTKKLVDLEHNLFQYMYKLPQFQPVDPAKFFCYVYLLQKKLTSEYKIGKSIEPLDRKFVLELGGTDLDIIVLIKIPNEALGLLWENLLHKTFEPESIGREWYILAPYQVAFIQSLAKAFEVLNKQ